MYKDKCDEMAELFKALGHPLRLRIVSGLIENFECNVNKMVEHLNVPQPNISQHLNILKNAGVIEGYRNGNQICYKVIHAQVRQILRQMEEIE